MYCVLNVSVRRLQVEWGWQEPQPVGETMCFTVLCYQRNGHPYPVCDTDQLTVNITHGTRKVPLGLRRRPLTRLVMYVRCERLRRACR